MILSLAFGRTRTGVAVIRTEEALESVGKACSTVSEKLSSRAMLVYHSEIPRRNLCDYIFERIGESLLDGGALSPSQGLGILIPDLRVSENNVETIRLHAVIQHELHRRFGHWPVDVSIQQIRRSLGISSPSSAANKRDLIHHFKSSGCVFENPQTNSGLQLLSESWGVGRHLIGLHRLKEMRSSSPDVIEKIRNELLSNRKLFSPSIHSNTEVINDLLDQEIDKLLVKRFNL